MAALPTDDALALWAHRSLPLKNTLTVDDAEAIETAYLAKLASCSEAHPASTETFEQNGQKPPQAPPMAALTKPVRRRSKIHLAFVASQPCLICKASPCDAHHLKIAQPRSLGRKVSDEFTVPLCRKHHQDLHRHGNEANWWANMQVVPMTIAKALWETSPAQSHSN
jgi:hypothetical protein